MSFLKRGHRCTVAALLLFGLCTGLLGCDQADPDSSQEPPLQITFDRAAENDTGLVVLSRFEAPWQPTLPLSQTAHTSVPSAQGLRIQTEGAEVDSSAVVFVVYRGQTRPKVNVFARAFAPSAGAAFGFREPFPAGKVYAFMIEGIGAPATRPVHVTIRAAGKTFRLEVDPDTHVLERRFALRVGHEDVSDLPPGCTISGDFRILLQRSKDYSESSLPAVPLVTLLYSRRAGVPPRWRSVAPSFRPEAPNFGLLFNRELCELESFKFYIFMLEPPS